MKVLITGGSSGIGKDIAKVLAEKGYENLILVARDETKLADAKKEIEEKYEKCNINIIATDLSISENVKQLYKDVGSVDLLVNNAGFGACGEFTKTSLDKELKMIDTNISAYHILTKLYLVDMQAKGYGKILNVASVAGFMPGPLMAAYYATKAYIVSLSESIREELKKEKSNVQLSILCPGPVSTNFNKVANVKFSILSEASSIEVAKYAMKKLDKGDFYIVPKLEVKLSKIGAKIFPAQLVAKVTYMVQRRKIYKE